MTSRCWFVSVLVLAACKQSSPNPAPSSASAEHGPAVAPAPASASRAEAPTEPAGYAGKWTGTYRSEQQPIVMQRSEGMVQAWAADTGKDGAGSGKIELDVDADGLVRGRSEGPLGILDATGTVDHDTLRVSLAPEAADPAKAFHGFLIGTRTGNSIAGTLQASSGDSLIVRKATVALEKH